MVPTPSALSERDQSEIERSASEARKVVLAPVQIDRYLDPPSNTPYGLEYAFHLLGDVKGKTVLDLGCGSGENLVVLVKRGAKVIAMDISPELVDLAQQRLANYGLAADLRVGSAYETGLPDESVDVVFSMALLHHLDLPRARAEIRRILRPGGLFIMREPVRLSKTMALLRRAFPDQEDISDFEHPLTKEELATVTEGFTVVAERSFRLPHMALLTKVPLLPKKLLWKNDRWLLQSFPILTHFATGKVMLLRK